MRHFVWFKTITNPAKKFPLLSEAKPSVLPPTISPCPAGYQWQGAAMEEIVACMKARIDGGRGM